MEKKRWERNKEKHKINKETEWGEKEMKGRKL
jgi:hypothetical protein